MSMDACRCMQAAINMPYTCAALFYGTCLSHIIALSEMCRRAMPSAAAAQVASRARVLRVPSSSPSSSGARRLRQLPNRLEGGSRSHALLRGVAVAPVTGVSAEPGRACGCCWEARGRLGSADACMLWLAPICARSRARLTLAQHSVAAKPDI